MDPIQPMNDHDLIITIHEQIKNVRADIADLKSGTSVQLADHETRIRKLETAKTETNTKLKIYVGLGGTIWSIIIILIVHFIH